MLSGSISKNISKITNQTAVHIKEAGIKAAESERLKKAVKNLGNSSLEILNESKKVTANIVLNVSIVAIVFFAINSAFLIYGIYLIFSAFEYWDLLPFSGLFISALGFSALVAFRCYQYAQFKIGLGIYHLLETFFAELIQKSFIQIEQFGAKKLTKGKAMGIVKSNSKELIKGSFSKVPKIIRKSILVLMEFLPIGDILVEIIHEAQEKRKQKIEETVKARLDTFVSSLQPQKQFTRFVLVTAVVNIFVMGCLVYWM